MCLLLGRARGVVEQRAEEYGSPVPHRSGEQGGEGDTECERHHGDEEGDVGAQRQTERDETRRCQEQDGHDGQVGTAGVTLPDTRTPVSVSCGRARSTVLPVAWIPRTPFRATSTSSSRMRICTPCPRGREPRRRRRSDTVTCGRVTSISLHGMRTSLGARPRTTASCDGDRTAGEAASAHHPHG